MMATKSRPASGSTPEPQDSVLETVRRMAAAGSSDAQIGAVIHTSGWGVRMLRASAGIASGTAASNALLAAALDGTLNPSQIPPDPNPHLRKPAPLDRTEPLSQMRLRALWLAEHHGLIGEFIGPVDAVNTDPAEWKYYYMPAGMTVEDLAEGQDPYIFEPAEVLPSMFTLALPAGLADEFRYRDGLPG